MNKPVVQPQTVLDEQRGLRCPKCGCAHFRVLYTRQTWGGALRRRRECRYCGQRITTTERVQ
jgi:transcriptional regulator NrdR family protein